MSEAFWIAIMNLAAKAGFNAVITLLENRGASLDDAIAALRKAQAVSLEEIIAAEAAKRLVPSPPTPPGP